MLLSTHFNRHFNIDVNTFFFSLSMSAVNSNSIRHLSHIYKVYDIELYEIEMVKVLL